MFFMMFAVCALASCTSDDFKKAVDVASHNEKNNVDIELVKLGYSASDETTRTLVTSDDFSSRFYNTVWNKNENIGLVKLSPNYVGNTKIPLSNASGTSSGSAENDLFKFLSPGDKIVMPIWHIMIICIQRKSYVMEINNPFQCIISEQQ